MKRVLIGIFILLSLLIAAEGYSQDTNKIVSDRFQEYRDSIQGAEPVYLFPIFSKKLQERGYDLPLPGGLLFGFYHQQQDLVLNNLEIGFGGSDLVNIDDLVEFSTLQNDVDVFTVRPDIWLFPFLSVYGVFSKVEARTTLVLSEPFTLEVPEINNSGHSIGFGFTAAYAIGRVFVSGNFNWSWTDMPQLVEKTQSFLTALRVGTTMYTRNRKHNLAVWTGASYTDYFGVNGGTYDLTQLIPEDNTVLEDLRDQLMDITDGLSERYNDFCAMPGNRAKCAVVDPLLEELLGRVEDKLAGISLPEELPLDYQFESSPKYRWTPLLGAQWTFNKRWQVRVEGGIGNRRTLLVNANYRFGLIKRKNKANGP